MKPLFQPMTAIKKGLSPLSIYIFQAAFSSWQPCNDPMSRGTSVIARRSVGHNTTCFKSPFENDTKIKYPMRQE